MDSPSSSPFSFLDLADQPIETPEEWMPALLVVPLDSTRLAAGRVLLQGSMLQLSIRLIAGELMVVGQWPRCGTGNYRLVLELDDDDEAPSAAAEQLVSIRPRKITEAAYVALVNDLQGDALPTSIALGLERTGGLAGIDLRSREATTLEQELLRLRRAVVGPDSRLGLASALSEISRDPYRVLRKTEEWVRSERARRLEPVGLVRALRRAENADPETRRPRQVPDVRVEHTHDVYENRLLRLFLDQVERRLRRLAAAFAQGNQLAGLAEVEKLQRRIAVAARQAQFLEEVSLPRYFPTQATMVLLRRPLYRAVFERFLEFHREAFVQLDDDRLDAPLDNLPHLYETWGTLELITAVLDVGHELGFVTQEQRIARHINNSVFIKVLPDGEPALVMVHADDRREIRVIPQKSFGRTALPHRSISFAQRPDLTVQLSMPEGNAKLLVFDPKYKLRSESMAGSIAEDDDSLEGEPGQPKKVDIDKMHAYRDAIRDERLRPVVSHAAILYPGATVQYEGGVAALSARPDDPRPLVDAVKEILRTALQLEDP